jgi:hypothetical protein
MERNVYLTGLNRETCRAISVLSTVKKQTFTHICEEILRAGTSEIVADCVSGDSPPELQSAHPRRIADRILNIPTS